MLQAVQVTDSENVAVENDRRIGLDGPYTIRHDVRPSGVPRSAEPRMCPRRWTRPDDLSNFPHASPYHHLSRSHGPPDP